MTSSVASLLIPLPAGSSADSASLHTAGSAHDTGVFSAYVDQAVESHRPFIRQQGETQHHPSTEQATFAPVSVSIASPAAEASVHTAAAASDAPPTSGTELFAPVSLPGPVHVCEGFEAVETCHLPVDGAVVETSTGHKPVPVPHRRPTGPLPNPAPPRPDIADPARPLQRILTVFEPVVAEIESLISLILSGPLNASANAGLPAVVTPASPQVTGIEVQDRLPASVTSINETSTASQATDAQADNVVTGHLLQSMFQSEPTAHPPKPHVEPGLDEQFIRDSGRPHVVQAAVSGLLGDTRLTEIIHDVTTDLRASLRERFASDEPVAGDASAASDTILRKIVVPVPELTVTLTPPVDYSEDPSIAELTASIIAAPADKPLPTSDLSPVAATRVGDPAPNPVLPATDNATAVAPGLHPVEFISEIARDIPAFSQQLPRPDHEIASIQVDPDILAAPITETRSPQPAAVTVQLPDGSEVTAEVERPPAFQESGGPAPPMAAAKAEPLQQATVSADGRVPSPPNTAPAPVSRTIPAATVQPAETGTGPQGTVTPSVIPISPTNQSAAAAPVIDATGRTAPITRPAVDNVIPQPNNVSREALRDGDRPVPRVERAQSDLPDAPPAESQAPQRRSILPFEINSPPEAAETPVPSSVAELAASAASGPITSGVTSSGAITENTISAPVPVTGQVASAIAQELRLLQQTGQPVRQISVRLDPPELGALRIQIRSAHDGLQMHVEAAEDVTLEMLASRVPEIEQLLKHQDVDVSRVTIQRMNTESGDSASFDGNSHGDRERDLAGSMDGHEHSGRNEQDRTPGRLARPEATSDIERNQQRGIRA